VEGYVGGLNEAMATGDVASGDATVLAWSLIAVGEAVGMRWILWDGSKAVPETVFDEMMAIVARMLGGRSGALACEAGAASRAGAGGPQHEAASNPRAARRARTSPRR